ncbi:PREDICTED: pectinesterase/pectinesterase inhibitor PPE8B [Nelumbo nucifera]|uniref:Pectinesterase n=1 Tax=Nelumbo nucifera TaxID=4432 RepID=A0A1U8AZS5_NELNU|nr:PREDICTED: pectinesterase/pectinesterase inhibitor PPE8B [Nelumbo nucifera]
MASRPTIILFLYLFSSFSTNSSSAAPSDFVATLKSTIDEVQGVISLVSKFANQFDDFRLSNALNDCVDLLDYSADELGWTLSATENPNSNDNSTGNRNSDLKAWLSAALGNQDTCLDGFEGTNSFVKGLVAGSLDTVTSLVSEVLGQIPSGGRLGRKLKSVSEGGGFPAWMKGSDRRLLQAPAGGVSADAVVAQDGTGQFTSVMDAVLAAPDYSERRYVIYVKRGVYKENVEIKKKKWNLMIVGDGMDVTIISGSRNFVDGWTTFRSATFAVSGKGFIARDITFENTAGPEKHQAVALRSDSDLSAYYRCAIKGYQDTLYAHSLRQFYRECRISGTVDFIFGNGAVVIQNCQILAKKGLPNQKNTITAQGRKDPNQNTGFSLQFSNMSADSDLIGSANSTLTYLGRPWKQYSRTVFMQSYMSDVIRPEGWLEWQGNFALDTLYYGEYMNYGPGAGLSSRVKWPGLHAITNSSQASAFTVAQFIDGNLWLPSTGVKFTAGLAV